MRDYEKLVERLRAGKYTVEELSIILPQAADAIEELHKELMELKVLTCCCFDEPPKGVLG